MYVVSVTIHVKPDRVDDFAAAIERNAVGSREEEGCVCFDVLQNVDEPTHFQLYEMYRSIEAFKSHQEQAHYLTWRDTVTDWMAQKRTSVKLNLLSPSEPNS